MWKRIVIGLVVVATAVIALAVFSGPKRGSVEWHKRKYFALIDRVYDRRPIDRVRRSIESKTGWVLRPNWNQKEQRLRTQAEKHRLALVESGYISKWQFIVYNRDVVWNLIRTNWGHGDRHRAFITCEFWDRDDALVVRGPRDDLLFWQEWLRKIDVPNWGGMLVPTIAVPERGK